MVQLSHPYMTTGKTIALIIWAFVGKIMSLLFNTLPFCHSFPSKEPASFNLMATVTVCSDFGIQVIKSVVVSIFPLPICQELMGLGKIPWRRAWQPTPAFLSGESHGQKSLVGGVAKSQILLK